MLTIVTFVASNEERLFVKPWEGALPEVDDTFALEVKSDPPPGPEMNGFNNSRPKWIIEKVRGTVESRCWTAPGELTISYAPEPS